VLSGPRDRAAPDLLASRVAIKNPAGVIHDPHANRQGFDHFPEYIVAIKNRHGMAPPANGMNGTIAGRQGLQHLLGAAAKITIEHIVLI
jgi:hypothetical protein